MRGGDTVTTPERLRRRQRIESFLVTVTIVLTVITGIYFNRQNQKQNECMAMQFHELSVTLNARADLTRREADAVAKVLITAANAKTGDQVAESLREYNKTRTQIAKERADNPLPKFPTGRCESGSKPGVFPPQRSSGIDGLGVFAPPHVDRVEGVDEPRSTAPVRGPVGDIAGDHQRHQDSGRGRPAGRPAGGSGSGGGGSDSGGGGSEPPRVPPAPVEPVVTPIVKTVDDVKPLLARVAAPVTATAIRADDDHDCEGDDG